MNQDLLKLNNRQNSVNEFLSYVCQGIPSAVFGVSKSFKNYLISCIDKRPLGEPKQQSRLKGAEGIQSSGEEHTAEKGREWI